MRDRVRGGRRRPEPRPGAAARAGRPGCARSPRGVRGRRRIERRGRDRVAAGGGGPRRHRSRRGRSAARRRRPVPAPRPRPGGAGTGDRRGSLRGRGAEDRDVAARADGPGRPRGRRRRNPTGRRPRDRRAAHRRRLRPSDFGLRFRTTARHRPAPPRDRGPRGAARRPVGAVGLVSHDRLQGPRRRRPPGRAVSGPRPADPGLVRPLPPALRDEHPADLAARPAVPLDRPQRRDRHGPGQPRAGPGQGRRRDRRRWGAARER